MSVSDRNRLALIIFISTNPKGCSGNHIQKKGRQKGDELRIPDNTYALIWQHFKTLSSFQILTDIKWAASSESGTYRLCEQRRFRRACASAQSRQNLRCSLIQAMSQEEPSDRKPDPCPLWMAGHAQLKVFMTECSKTQIRLTRPKWRFANTWTA